MTLDVDDFNHGDLRIRVFDGVGDLIHFKTYRSIDWFWYIDGGYYDIDFTDSGVAGSWTILLDFSEFTGEVELTLEALDAPMPDPEVPPPTETSPLLDVTFGDDGRGGVTTDTARGRRIALDSSGRSVVVGTSVDADGVRRLAVWRFLVDGSLDPGFGLSGRFTFEGAFASGGFGIAIDGTGRVLASGWRADEGRDTDLLVLRLVSAGTLDPTFGTGGSSTIDDGADDIGASVALDGTGSVIVAGASRDLGTNFGNALIARFTTSGTLDGSFGNGGIARTPNAGDRGWDVAIDSLDRPIVVGFREPAMVMWKFTTAGTLDPSFGAGGVVTSAGGGGQFRVARSLAIKSDGTIAVAGAQFSDGADPLELALWRFASDGSPLTMFNGGGFLAYRYADGSAAGGDVVFDGFGAMLVLSTTKSLGATAKTSATLWRYFDTGAVDATLTDSDATGAARFDARSDGVNTAGSSLVLTPTGDVLATGGVADEATRAIDLVLWKLLP